MFVPQNEQGVVFLFGTVAHKGNFSVVEIATAYPDAVVSRGEQRYRVEFEYLASSFLRHRHDPRDCDLIICWENDYPDSVLPVIALSEDDWHLKVIAMASPEEKEIAYWKQRAHYAENRRNYWKAEAERLSGTTRTTGFESKDGHYTCSCGRSFDKHQALAGHSRYCDVAKAERGVAVSSNGRANGLGH